MRAAASAGETEPGSAEHAEAVVKQMAAIDTDETATATVRVHPAAPLFKLYILNNEEAFFGFYAANQYESFMIKNRMFGPYGHMYWALILCNVVAPNTLWWPRLRLGWARLAAMSLSAVIAASSMSFSFCRRSLNSS